MDEEKTLSPFADLSRFPTDSGVYLMKDEQGLVLYVGKAKNLRARLRNYQGEGDGRQHIRFLVRKVHSIETIITDSEKEALLLENTLIKKHHPRFNIRLRDDKTYVSLRMDPREDFPFLQLVRRVKKDGARYFGPFPSGGAVKETLKRIHRLFPLRHFPAKYCERRGRPCLYHQIGQCCAPCAGLVSREEYRQLAEGALAFLAGDIGEATGRLRERMKRAAAALRFEEAASLRDQILALEATTERQKVAETGSQDLDVAGLQLEGGEAVITMLFVRGGQMVGRRDFSQEWILDRDELLMAFLQQYYESGVPVPDRVLLPFLPEGAASLEEWLGEKKGRKVRVLAPQRGDAAGLVRLAERNASEAVRTRGSRREARERVLTDIRTALSCRRLPLRMECFDISHFQGSETVGSMAVFREGEAAHGEYRHYRVKTVSGPDDFASLAEVLRRRLERGIREENLPDFILVDGGRGQLSSVMPVVEELGLEKRIDVVGIAKDRVTAAPRADTIEHKGERFFLPGESEPRLLPEGSPALFMLERLRNEAHRFAIEQHRRKRGKAALVSELDAIAGIGPKRRKALLQRFGSVAGVRAASFEELREILPETVAAAIKNSSEKRG
ncbi:MAG: excinuclease ABC subunit UvrC [bacterium]|nr:excinuclease ABC subunit UvrC [bacterium]